MPLFLTQKRKRIQEFTSELVNKLEKRYPATIDNNPAKRVSENRLTRLLKDRGYSEKFVNVATEGLMVYITNGPPAKPASGERPPTP
jgi:hypothetical protein